MSRLTVVMRQIEERVRVSRRDKKQDERRGMIGVGREMRDGLVQEGDRSRDVVKQGEVEGLRGGIRQGQG